MLNRTLQLALATVLATSGCGALTTIRNSQAKRHLDKAEVYLDQGLDEQALEAFSLALQDNPRLVEAHMGIGDVYRVRQDYRTASQSYEKAVALAPTSFDAHYYLGLARQLVGDLTRAVRVYLRTLAIHPYSFEANQNLASTYLQMGRPESAIPYAMRSTALDPQSQAAWANLGAAYSLTGQYDLALQAYREAVELGEMATPVLLGLADAHIRLGNFERAIVVLRTQTRRAPSPTAYERLGYAQFKLHRFNDALASFRVALSLDEGGVAALNGVGACLMTLYIQGGHTETPQRDEALRAWRRSVRTDLDQPRIIDLISRYRMI